MESSNPDATLGLQTYGREFNFDNTLILDTKSTSYVVSIPSSRAAEEKINARINMQLMNFMKNTIMKILPQAKENYIEAKRSGYPFNPFGTGLDYTATYNEKGILSMYRDYYEYLGGAHPTTTRSSDTYDLKTGRVLPLQSFFPRGCDYVEKLIKEIRAQAEKNFAENPGIYFDNYPELILKYFNSESFYISPNGLTIYYQQYDLGPYAVGILEFTISFDKLKEMCK
jgi:Protein of unknown function (DUF3298).